MLGFYTFPYWVFNINGGVLHAVSQLVVPEHLSQRMSSHVIERMFRTAVKCWFSRAVVHSKTVVVTLLLGVGVPVVK